MINNDREHALPMGMTLEGGEGGKLDAGDRGWGWWSKTVGGGRIQRLFHIHKLAHRSLQLNTTLYIQLSQ